MKVRLDKHNVPTVKGGEIIWQPDSLPGKPLKFGKQYEFLTSPEDYIGYDGGKGSAKTEVLVWDCLRPEKVENPRWHGVIFRREYKRLTEVIDRATYWLKQVPEFRASWQGEKSRFIFPSGAWLAFHNVEGLGDEKKYQGWEICDLKFDQLEEFLEPIFDFLVLQNRTSGKGLYPTVKWTANPIGVGRTWVKRRFIDGKKPGVTHNMPVTVGKKVFNLTYRRIFATVYDNPVYCNDEKYIARLASEPNPYIRKALFEGDWDTVIGGFFPFISNIHVIPSTELDHSWQRLAGCDYGNVKVLEFLTRDYAGNVFCEWEYVSEPNEMKPGGETATEFGEGSAKFMLDRGIGSRMRVIGDTNMWSATGRDVGTDKTPAMIIQRVWNQLFKEKKVAPPILVPVSKRATEEYRYRVACNEAVKDFLRYKLDDKGNLTQPPQLFFLDRCMGIINSIASLVTSESDPMDIADDQDDHKWDCYDEETEVLTLAGWKKFSSLSVADSVATLSSDYNVVYQNPTKIIADYYKGTMLSHESNGSNFRVTPNHKMVIVKYRDWNAKQSRNWSLVPMKDLQKWSYIPKAGHKCVGELPRTLRVANQDVDAGDFLEFLGFWLAEGFCDKTTKRHRVIVDQKIREDADGILRRLPFHYNVNFGKLQCHRFTFTSKLLWRWFQENALTDCYSHTKFIPRWVFALDPLLLSRLYRGMMLGDGTMKNNKTSFYATVSRKLADDFQELCFKLGLTATIHLYQPKPNPKAKSPLPMYRITISNNRIVSELRESEIKPTGYDGMVYCVSVPEYHTLYVRRKGNAMWCGNSFKMPFLELHPSRVKKTKSIPKTEIELLEQTVFEKKYKQMLRPKRSWSQY